MRSIEMKFSRQLANSLAESNPLFFIFIPFILCFPTQKKKTKKKFDFIVLPVMSFIHRSQQVKHVIILFADEFNYLYFSIYHFNWLENELKKTLCAWIE